MTWRRNRAAPERGGAGCRRPSRTGGRDVSTASEQSAEEAGPLRERDVVVLDSMHRQFEVVLLLAVAPEAELGDVEVFVETEVGEGWILAGKLDGAPPPVDLSEEIKAGRLVLALIREGKTQTVHDIADGGLMVALAEMALAGGVGIELYPYEGRLPRHAVWFGEDQSRYLIAVSPDLAEDVIDRARLLALPARIIGRAGGEALTLEGEPSLPLTELRHLHEGWLPRYMQGQ